MNKEIVLFIENNAEILPEGWRKKTIREDSYELPGCFFCNNDSLGEDPAIKVVTLPSKYSESGIVLGRSPQAFCLCEKCETDYEYLIYEQPRFKQSMFDLSHDSCYNLSRLKNNKKRLYETVLTFVGTGILSADVKDYLLGGPHNGFCYFTNRDLLITEIRTLYLPVGAYPTIQEKLTISRYAYDMISKIQQEFQDSGIETQKLIRLVTCCNCRQPTEVDATYYQQRCDNQTDNNILCLHCLNALERYDRIQTVVCTTCNDKISVDLHNSQYQGFFFDSKNLSSPLFSNNAGSSDQLCSVLFRMNCTFMEALHNQDETEDMSKPKDKLMLINTLKLTTKGGSVYFAKIFRVHCTSKKKEGKSYILELTHLNDDIRKKLKEQFKDKTLCGEGCNCYSNPVEAAFDAGVLVSEFTNKIKDE